MPESPLSATPYEVLGVSVTASQDELRRAYRRLMRETHPDLGGDPRAFNAVQLAWERVGTEQDRAAYDRGRNVPSAAADEPSTWTASGSAGGSSTQRADSRPRARTYGHPGGDSREVYLRLIREWAGRGTDLADPYDPALVRSAPREIRHELANALAEEATARTVSTLGIGYTVWHDVLAPGHQKVDHVVLGPTGLFAIKSEDWGGTVRVHRGEVVGETLATGEEPVKSLVRSARTVGKAARVKFTAYVIVVPDEALEESLEIIGRRHPVTVLVSRSRLADLLRSGLPGIDRMGGNELFDTRTKLQSTIRFV
ncbi:J domain-containing protein [Plantibacter sp. Mn2098]|uniref:J domain-containing protein n=1 Tax=Plantibacter sp. Mn2098 TaxID=3395266 RepID=UPI003BC56B72